MKKFCTAISAVFVFFVFFSSFLFLPCQAADHWGETARKVLALSGQMDERSLFSERFAHEDRAVLEKKIATLKNSIAKNTQFLEQATIFSKAFPSRPTTRYQMISALGLF